MVHELTDLDYARYLINFDRIEITLHSSGLWRAHYIQPCRHLDLESRQCTVHGTDRQPLTCKSFNAWQCSYKRIFDGQEEASTIRLDRQRLEYLATQMVFDSTRRLIEMPDLETLKQSLPPRVEQEWPEARGSKILSRWREAEIQGEPESVPVEYPFQGRPDPCSGCEAWCCTRLNFPQDAPALESNLEYLRFLAGFPGIELGFSPGGWTAVVRTTCRHRIVEPSGQGRCGIYGQLDRPIACQSYQGLSCAYKARFGGIRPQAYIRIEYDTLDAVLGLYRVDEQGTIRTHPSYEQVREAVTQDWVTRST